MGWKSGLPVRQLRQSRGRRLVSDMPFTTRMAIGGKITSMIRQGFSFRSVNILWVALVAGVLTGDSKDAASLSVVATLPEECGTIQLISNQVGWCGDLSALFQTTDGGKTWGALEVPMKKLIAPLRENVWDFQLLTPHSGWARTDTGLFWTEDEGQTWGEYQLPLRSMIEGEPRGLIHNMHFATRQVGWALSQREVPGDPSKEAIRYRIAGEHSVYVPALFRTTNGGNTWSEQTYPDLGGIADGLEFADSNHGLSIELNATLYTSDGGRTWHESHYCPAVNEKSLHYAELGTGTFWRTTAQLLDPSLGWWAVESDLFRTTDGGATWCQLPSIRYKGEIVPIHQIRFATRNLGWAVPDFTGRWDHPIPPLQTRDGGKSWSALTVPPDTHVEGCSMLLDRTVYCWGRGHLYRILGD